MPVIHIPRSEVMTLAATAVAYHLADDSSFSSRHITSPDTDTDTEILTLLWRLAASRIGSLLPTATVTLADNNISGIDTTLPELPVGQLRLIRETMLTLLATHIAAGWLRIANHVEATPLLEASEEAASAIAGILAQVSQEDEGEEAAPHIRLTLSPL